MDEVLTAEAEHDDDGATSDAALIAAVREGDADSFGRLFERHAVAARRLARQLSPSDADDLVAEAFTRMLSLLQDGKGPDAAFRAYLLTAIRRLHVDRIRATTRTRPTDQDHELDRGVDFVDTAAASFENGAAAQAFRSLPERWQLVLWHLEVEGQKPADVAPLLGMSANSVSALAYRAREGLRQAYLQSHLTTAPDDQCRTVTGLLGGYVRQGLSARDARKVDQHLDDCRYCTGLYLELVDVNQDLRAVLAPVVLGGAAAGYLGALGVSGAALTGVAAGGAAVGLVTTGLTSGGVAATGVAAGGVGTGVVAVAGTTAGASAAGLVTAGSMAAGSVVVGGSLMSTAVLSQVARVALLPAQAAVATAATAGAPTLVAATVVTGALTTGVVVVGTGTGPGPTDPPPAVSGAPIDEAPPAPADRAPTEAAPTPSEDPLASPDVPEPTETPGPESVVPPSPVPTETVEPGAPALPDPSVPAVPVPEPPTPTDFAIGAVSSSSLPRLLARRVVVPVVTDGGGARPVERTVTVRFAFTESTRFLGVAAGWSCDGTLETRVRTLDCTTTLPAGQGGTLVVDVGGLLPRGTVSVRAPEDPRPENDTVAFRTRTYLLAL